MAKHNGYFSQKSFELYDTTGTTEDWSYNTAGGFGFTFEIYCGAPELRRPATATTRRSTRSTRRWSRSGRARTRRPTTTLPGAPNAGFDGKGNREAYYIAAESTPQRAAPQRARGQRRRPAPRCA